MQLYEIKQHGKKIMNNMIVTVRAPEEKNTSQPYAEHVDHVVLTKSRLKTNLFTGLS